MRTREKSKAQLLREVSELKAQVAKLEESTKKALHREDAAQERAKNLDHTLQNARDQVKLRDQDLEKLEKHRQELQYQVNRSQEIITELRAECDKFKAFFLEEQSARRKVKELLVRQAHLAGELAQMVTPANLHNRW